MNTQYLKNLVSVLETQEKIGVIAPGTKDDLMKTVEHLVRVEEEKAYVES